MAIALQTVQNIIKDAKGTAISGVVVNIDLVLLDIDGAVSSIPQGFVNDGAVATDWTINAGTTVTTNVSGVWTTGATMVPNSLISGVTNSCYKITENTTVPRIYYIQVPTSGTPHWVGGILYSTPGLTGSFVAPALTFRSISATANILASDSAIVATNTITLTLPAISGTTVGKQIYIKNANTTALTVTVAAGTGDSAVFGTTNGAAVTQTITQGNARVYTTDGTKWYNLS